MLIVLSTLLLAETVHLECHYLESLSFKTGDNFPDNSPLHRARFDNHESSFHNNHKNTKIQGHFRVNPNKNARLKTQSGVLKAAAAYSPTWWGSTIGVSVLNFSVRYGKRWIHTAITTAVFF